MPLPVANSIKFCVGKSYLNPSILSDMGKPDPITWDTDRVDPEGQDVIHELYSVFFTRNSHVAGTGTLLAPSSASAAAAASLTTLLAPGEMRLGAVPVGALAMARKIGFVSSSAYIIFHHHDFQIIGVISIKKGSNWGKVQYDMLSTHHPPVSLERTVQEI